MSKKTLHECAIITMGQSPNSKSYNGHGDGLPFYQGNADFGEINPIRRYYCNKPSKIANRIDILLSVRAPIGAVNIAVETCCIGRGLCAISEKRDITYYKYLYYFLLSRHTELNSKGTGSTFKAISKSILLELSISLPPIEEQKRISRILDKVNDLISLKKKQISKLDLLVKSRFVEMFGDPVMNTKRWEIGTIRDLVRDVKYGTSKPAEEHGKHIYLRMNNITYNGSIDLTNIKHINVSDKDYEKYVVHKGDLLFNRTNSKELVGKTAVFKEDTQMIIAGYIIRVRTNEKANPEYVSAFLNSKYGKEMLYDMCKAIVGQANINAQELQNIKIPIVPLDLQNQFAEFVQQVDKLEFTIENKKHILKGRVSK